MRSRSSGRRLLRPIDSLCNIFPSICLSVWVHADIYTDWSRYHALESFAQLIQFDFDSKGYFIRGAPVSIVDQPRFAWRELMVDTSRHFLPIPVPFEILNILSASFHVFTYSNAQMLRLVVFRCCRT